MSNDGDKARHAASHGTYGSYVKGFALSIVFTLSAYFAVVNNWMDGNILVAFIVLLAIVQLIVQLVFFLHVGHEKRPRQNTLSFLFAALVILIVVIGSLWIMSHLGENMTGDEVEQEIMNEENIHY